MSFLFSVKKRARKFLDSFSNLTIKSKKEIGSRDSWFVLTDFLHNAIVFSGGVGKDITFEIALAEHYHCQVFLFDPSPTGIKTINALPNIPNTLKFFPVGLANVNTKVQFDPPENPDEGSFTLSTKSGSSVEFECRSLSSLVNEFGIKDIELLKIDIEGFEYGVIDDVLKSKLNVRQICVEFHDFMKEIPRKKTRQSIQSLLDNGYRIIHKRGHDYSFVKF